MDEIAPDPPQTTASAEDATPTPPALYVESLSKSYEGTRALDNLSFRLEPGRILGLVGPNGAGKTTALRSIAGILPIREGRVLVCGHDVSVEEVEAKRCLGWVPDDPEPFDALTVWEHLEFIAALFRVDPWKERAEDLLERFELTAKRDALGGELSRGMRQKLAFSCVWLPRPRLVLLDEPLSGLDPRGIRAAKEAIGELAAGGTSVLLSSHLLDLIEALADEILILDQGRSVFSGSMAAARERLSPQAGSSLEEIFFAATGETRPPPAAEEAAAETGSTEAAALADRPGSAAEQGVQSTFDRSLTSAPEPLAPPRQGDEGEPRS